MAARGQNVVADSGDDLLLRITVRKRDRATRKLVPVDLVGGAFTWVLTSASGQTELARHTTADGHARLEEGSINVVLVDVLPEDTDDLEGAHKHELEVVDASGRTAKVLAGSFKVIADLTP